MKEEDKFFKILNMIARVCDFELDSEVIELYDHKLATYGYENVNRALLDIFYNRDSKDQFPSIAEVVKNVNCEVSSRTQSDNIASIILNTFNSWGMRYTADENFQDWFVQYNGELAWAVLQKMGGYKALFNEWNYCKNISTLRAQIRDAGTAVIELAKHGQLWTPHPMPKQISGNKKLNELVGKTVKVIG